MAPRGIAPLKVFWSRAMRRIIFEENNEVVQIIVDKIFLFAVGGNDLRHYFISKIIYRYAFRWFNP